MQNELSIVNLIINADIVVQAIMLILIIASIISWTLIFNKKTLLFKENKELFRFNKSFGIEESIGRCYNSNFKDHATQILNDSKNEVELVNGIEVAYRKINLRIKQRVERLEKNISTLAIIASSAPFIGLFGTVWGIMHSFLSLASVKQATISVVAPGIAEALIATAFGLFAAIPASIYYNKLTTEVELIYSKYQGIAEQFLIVMQREKG